MARNYNSDDRDSTAGDGDNFYRDDFFERLDSLQNEFEENLQPYGEVSSEDALINNPYLSRRDDYFRERLDASSSLDESDQSDEDDLKPDSDNPADPPDQKPL